MKFSISALSVRRLVAPLVSVLFVTLLQAVSGTQSAQATYQPNPYTFTYSYNCPSTYSNGTTNTFHPTYCSPENPGANNFQGTYINLVDTGTVFATGVNNHNNGINDSNKGLRPAADGSFTLEAWVKSPDYSTQHAVILMGASPSFISQREGAVTVGTREVKVISGTSYTFWYVDVSGWASMYFRFPTSAMSVNQWHWIVVNQDSTNGLELFVDGVPGTPTGSVDDISAPVGARFVSGGTNGSKQLYFVDDPARRASNGKMLFNGSYQIGAWFGKRDGDQHRNSVSGVSFGDIRYTAPSIYSSAAASLTVPTAAPTKLPGTQLLLTSGNLTNGITDESGNQQLEFVNVTTNRANQSVNGWTTLQTQAALNITNSSTYVNTPTTLFTSGGSGSGAVTFVVNSGPCTISGDILTASAAGTCVVVATKANDGTYNSINSATRSISVSAFSGQTITFETSTAATITSGTITLGVTSGKYAATASSGLAPTYSSTSVSVCSVSTSGVVTLLAIGTCAIKASQAGNATFAAAADVTRNLSIVASVPDAPTILSVSTGGGATSTSGTATLNFQPGRTNGAAIDSYTVTATAGGSTISVTSTDTVTTVTGLTLGTAYTVAVRAYNSAGASTFATYGSTVTPAGAPFAVTNLRTTQSAAGSLRVNFTPPVSLNGGTFESYKYYIIPQGGTFSNTPSYSANAPGANGTTDPAYTFTGLTTSQPYNIKVVVTTNGNGASLDSFTAIVSQIPAGAPNAPQVALTQLDSQTVRATWNATGDNGSPISAWTVSLTVDGNAATCTRGSFNANSETCTVTSFSGGEIVRLVVTGTNVIGASPAGTANLTVIGVVAAPTNLVASPSSGAVSISFSQLLNGDSAIYYLYSSDGANYTRLDFTASPVSITGLSNGTSYTVRLKAAGAFNGVGPASAPLTFIVQAPTSTTSSNGAPDPKQTSSITTTAYECVNGTGSINLAGSFAARIFSISINNFVLNPVQWVQSLGSVTVNPPAELSGLLTIQIYNGQIPLLPSQSIAYSAKCAAVTATPTPTPTPTPAPTPKPAINVQPNNTMKKIAAIGFDLNSYFLSTAARLQITKLAEQLNANPAKTVLIYGNTDAQGGVDNVWLSKQRAKAVRVYMSPMLKEKKIRLGWFAATRPAVKGNSKAAYAANRRVEIWVK